jgi:gliding motility-associated-like protein
LQTPLTVTNPVLTSIKNVTVSDFDQIDVVWHNSGFSQFKQFRVEKFEDTEDNFVESFYLTDTFLRDNSVLTDEHSYIYRVYEEDQCGNSTVSDREGKSILLNVTYLQYPLLEWSEYVNWESGVKHYNVEILKNAAFAFIHRNDGTDRDYTDEVVHLDIPGKYCYRVHGVNEEGDTSYSNTECVVGEPKVLLPTAFTPNNDPNNLNETFKPITQFIQLDDIDGLVNFKFTVYSRWGEKIFETSDPLEGWNGQYNLKPCQQSVYIYTLQARGIDNKMIYKQGNVTLLR